MENNKIDLNGKTILVTGAAGFIASHLIRELFRLYHNITIIGVDNLNDYYDVNLKLYRVNKTINIANSFPTNRFEFIKENIANKQVIDDIFTQHKPSIVVNLAAQAGVGYSITNPDVYMESNVIGFYNILECCRKHKVEHLVYASSSSVYGENEKRVKQDETHNTDNPISFYAATKKSNEVMAYSYSHQYGFPSTGLRFFTVYGPEGRPDMGYFKFTKKLIDGEKIDLYNHGNNYRDYTYIDVVIDYLIRVIKNPPLIHDIFNVGNEKPTTTIDMLTSIMLSLQDFKILPENFDLRKHINNLPEQVGDVSYTFASLSHIENKLSGQPKELPFCDVFLKLNNGIWQFVKWYKEYYNIKKNVN